MLCKCARCKYLYVTVKVVQDGSSPASSLRSELWDDLQRVGPEPLWVQMRTEGVKTDESMQQRREVRIQASKVQRVKRRWKG